VTTLLVVKVNLKSKAFRQQIVDRQLPTATVIYPCSMPLYARSMPEMISSAGVRRGGILVVALGAL